MSKIIKRTKIPDIDLDQQAEKYQVADHILQKAGYTWYEISNWAREVPKYISQHNLNYWENGEWLGLGVSAHSHLLQEDSKIDRPNINPREVRHWNFATLRQYYAGLDSADTSAIEGEEIIGAREARLERIMLSTRLNLPITRMPDVVVSNRLRTELQSDGLIDEQFIPTVKGRMLHDEIVRRIDAQPYCPFYNTTQCKSCPQCIVE
jgi:oxygen-independent coproporphyrinogen-3 oxidase